MAFSLITAVLDIEEFKIPALVLDGVAVFGLYTLESKRKARELKAELVEAKKVALQHEAEKQAKKAHDAEMRVERKAMEKRAKEGAGKHPKHSNNPIQQPDKSKKSK
mmetsp:Transcript_12802/g.24327  ORF Transcript_12802/g.24327 Transcript_12802/m.24327 type:complete len:107 (-) Transcript_12802:80-400(-)